MKNLLQELFYEAQNGKVVIDNDEWPISFNTIIYEDGKEVRRYEGDNNATLEIHNEESFLKKIEDYVKLELEKNRKTPPYREKEKSREKALLAYLWVNATTEDFKNPEQYLDKRIQMLKDDSFSYLENGIEIEGGSSLLDSKIRIEKKENAITMETPYRIDITLEKGDCEASLPSIDYAIVGDTCYIYSIKKRKAKTPSSEEEEKYQKKINRLLYKVNEGVDQNEDITDITHSFLISLTIFMSLLEAEGIKNIKVVTYLPTRYLSRELGANESERKEELLERNDQIQTNLTDKLVRLFRRYCYHNENVEITSYPYDSDEYLSLKITDKNEKIKNQMIEEVTDSIKEGNESYGFHQNV